MNRLDSRTAARIARIIKVLEGVDLDQWQIAERIVLSRNHARDYVKNMVEHNEMHIIGWKRYGVSGKHIPICRLGPGESVPMPGPVPDTERRRNKRRELRGNQEAHAQFLRRQRARKRKPPKPDPVLAALFGTTTKGQVNENV